MRQMSGDSISASIEARDFAAVESAGSSSIPALLYALRDPQIDNVISVWAYQALRRLGKSAVPALIRALSHPSASIRRDAVHALERIKDRDATEALVRTLNDEDANVRLRTVQALGQLGDDRAVEPLIHLLNDRDRAIAHCATTALVGIGISAVPPLMQVLEDRRQDEIVRWRSAHTLGISRTPQVSELLIRILRDQSQPSYVRQGAAVGLIYFGGDQVVEALIEALTDNDGAVRASAARALGGYARYTKEKVDRRPVEPLIRTLTADDDPRARWMAALALQFFYDERALPPLLRLRRIPATSIEEKRIKEAAGFVVRNMRRVGRRRAVTMDAAQNDFNVP